MQEITADSFHASLRNIEITLRRKYAITNSIDTLTREHIFEPNAETKTLDLGCGNKPKNPFNALNVYGIDSRDDLGPLVKQANLAVENIPYPDNYFDSCSAFDVIEHIPRIYFAEGKTRYCFIQLMNEIHRILKPNGLFIHLTPCYPATEAFQDPTHVNLISEDTFPIYFCEPNPIAKEIGYGFNGAFELKAQNWTSKSHIAGIMQALK